MKKTWISTNMHNTYMDQPRRDTLEKNKRRKRKGLPEGPVMLPVLTDLDKRCKRHKIGAHWQCGSRLEHNSGKTE